MCVYEKKEQKSMNALSKLCQTSMTFSSVSVN